MVILGLALGALIGLGVLLVVAGAQGRDLLGTSRRRRRPTKVSWSTAAWQRLGIAVGAGLLTGLLTRWPIAALSVTALVILWPRLFGSGATGEREVDRVEALAVWTESLRDTIAGAMSLEQAIPATMDAAPAVLVEPLQHLVATMRARVPLPEALSRFADELDDASADLIVAALVLNANLRGPGLEAALTELGEHARDELELRQRVEAGRKPLRRAAWIIVGFTLVFVAGLAIFARDYVAPYSSPTGQIALAVVVGLFAAAFVWARKLSEYAALPRFLIGPDDLARVQMTGARS